MAASQAATVVPLRSGERPTISVVICAYTEGRWEELVAAVDSAARQTLAASEVIVVADHNTALAERARRELTGVEVLENDNRQGLAGARNTGVAAARGTVVAFLDDDAVAAADWLERLADAYEGRWCSAWAGRSSRSGPTGGPVPSRASSTGSSAAPTAGCRPLAGRSAT